MTRLSRRQWLRHVAAATAGGVALPYLISSKALAFGERPGANERIAVGFIGVGSRAKLLIGDMPDQGQIVAVSDCYLKQCHDAAKENQADWRIYQDYRKLLDQKDIDAVVVPTTDHARVLVCLHACQAGKDIYAEKPMSLYMQEGRVLVNAVKKSRCIFQFGTQQRSMEMNRCACDFIRSGQLGKIKRVQAVFWDAPDRQVDVPEEPIPEGFDWDMWLGQAECRPYNVRYFNGWRWIGDFGGGEMTNMGVHGYDQIQSALGMDHTGPVEFWPVSSDKKNYVSFRYANGIQVDLDLKYRHGPEYGPIVTGENGKIEITRNKFTTNPKDLIKDRPPAEVVAKWRDGTDVFRVKGHIENWLDCIKTRQQPIADVETGHRSTSLCHLVNITRELDCRIKWDPAKEQVIDDNSEANLMLVRPRRKGFELQEMS